MLLTLLAPALSLGSDRTALELTSHQMTLEDRVTVVERDQLKHETSDIVTREDTRKNTKDLMLEQGKQDERIADLDSKTKGVYQSATILAWVFSILLASATTLFVVFYQDYRKEAIKHHEALQLTLDGFSADIKRLDKHFNLLISGVAGLPEELIH